MTLSLCRLMGEHMLPKGASYPLRSVRSLCALISAAWRFQWLARRTRPRVKRGLTGSNQPLPAKEPLSSRFETLRGASRPERDPAYLRLRNGYIELDMRRRSSDCQTHSDGQRRSIIEPNIGISAMSAVCGMGFPEGSVLRDNSTGAPCPA